MNKREQAQIILEVLDRQAPTNINWAMEEQWLKAIEEGLREVEKHGRQAENPRSAAAGAAGNR